MNFAQFLRTPFYRIPLGDCFCHILTSFKIVELNGALRCIVLIPVFLSETSGRVAVTKLKVKDLLFLIKNLMGKPIRNNNF